MDQKKSNPCVVCLATLSNDTMKALKLQDTNHPTLKDKPIQLFEKKLASKQISETNLPHFTTINDKAKKASYLLSLRK